MIPEHDNVSMMTDDELIAYHQHHRKQAVLKNNGQLVRKILLNSFYGSLANVYSPLFDLRLAESITLSGQLSIRWAGKCMNDYLNSIHKTTDVDYIIYTDTDSIYVDMEMVAQRLSNNGINFDINNPDDLHKVVNALDKFCQDYAEPALSRGYEEMHKYCNSYQQKMFMDREVISDNSVFCSKKRYMMSVWNSEGVAFDEAYIKVMGMDMVKSSTPQVVRDAMKKTANIVLNGSEQDLHTYVKGFREKFNNLPPEAIAFPRGVNKLEETYCKPNGSFRDDVTVVINSRAAINFNNAIKSYDLDYPLIVNGDKIKYVHLTEPNKFQTHVFGFTDTLPKELDIHKKVDYSMMLEKTYLKPMNDLVNIIGWSLEPRASIDAFFG
ncbi:DNA polymerase [Vibrio phage henriette 12B8]|uniref:DNA polymerase n=1 Tax=Vibrio phage henriette 12B8 TaxID=573174 RepID=UPI0002C11E42|nr:DNA polymerase [Vibrio phage henriette 12B8]AGG58190.1 DNA polymerase [Vibrio phage henriette 12B8]